MSELHTQHERVYIKMIKPLAEEMVKSNGKQSTSVAAAVDLKRQQRAFSIQPVGAPAYLCCLSQSILIVCLLHIFCYTSWVSRITGQKRKSKNVKESYFWHKADKKQNFAPNFCICTYSNVFRF
jgi:hypothetical protein